MTRGITFIKFLQCFFSFVVLSMKSLYISIINSNFRIFSYLYVIRMIRVGRPAAVTAAVSLYAFIRSYTTVCPICALNVALYRRSVADLFARET